VSEAWPLLGRKLRLAVLGGGPGSFIGPIHRAAARLDDRFEIVAGVLSSDLARNAEGAAALGIRAYPSLEALVDGERKLDAVAIMTPNHRHHAECLAAIEAGLHVICDKPITNSVAEAQDIAKAVRGTMTVFCLTHAYAAYPMIRQARAMVAAGAIGPVRAVQVEYLQAGMAAAVEEGPRTRKLDWKLDPARSGPSLVLGDIGTHAHQLACFVTNGQVTQVSADVGAVVPGRVVDDYAAILWRFDHGARGACVVTQAAAGAENNLTLRVYGEKGMLEWQHAAPNYLRHAPQGAPVQVLGRGDPWLDARALGCIRVSRGHPEGFTEAFANLYAEFAEAILASRAGTPLAAPWFPTVEDGLHGIRFVEAAVQSSRQSGAWAPCTD